MSNDFDVRRARKETIATKNIIHFNNAGASLMPQPVSQVLHEYLNNEEQFGGYETADKYVNSLNSFYDSTAKLLNCSNNEIAYIENATRAWDVAFYSFKFQPGDRILASMAEYGSSVIAYLQQAKKFGVEVVYIPNDEHGQLDTKILSNLIDDRVKLISVTHIPTGGGLVNPVAEVGKIAKSAGIPFLLDACQAVGQLHLDVDEIGCDILCGTGRKYLRGPRGTGFLYVRSTLIEKLEPPLLDQHAADLISPTEYKIRPDAKRFENWEQFCAGKVALGKAIEYSLSWGLPAIQKRIYALANYLRNKLSCIDNITVTDEGIEKCGIVTFFIKNIDPFIIQSTMASHKINVSVSKGAGSMISFHHRGLDAVIRSSVHYYNTEEEIDCFIEALNLLIKAN